MFLFTNNLSFVGHYLYIEASSPRHPNDRAVITSQVFDATNQTTCFQFWYSMVGSQIGSLNAYVIMGGVKIPMWSLSGNQQTPWSQGRFPVKATQTFQVGCLCLTLE